MGTGSFTGVKRPGRGVDHPPHLAPRLKKGQIYTSASLWVFVASSRVKFTVTFTKHFVAPQQCKRNQSLHCHDNTEHFYMLTATSKPTTIKREHTVAVP